MPVYDLISILDTRDRWEGMSAAEQVGSVGGRYALSLGAWQPTFSLGVPPNEPLGAPPMQLGAFRPCSSDTLTEL